MSRTFSASCTSVAAKFCSEVIYDTASIKYSISDSIFSPLFRLLKKAIELDHTCPKVRVRMIIGTRMTHLHLATTFFARKADRAAAVELKVLNLFSSPPQYL